MEILEKPRTHFQFPHSLKNEPCIWGVRNGKERVAPLETARRWYGAMLTTCPNCLHVFDQPLSSSCCASSRSNSHVASPLSPAPAPPPAPSLASGGGSSGGGGGGDAPSTQATAAASAAAAAAMAAASLLQSPPQAAPAPAVAPAPVLLSATLQLPAGAVPTTCTLAVTAAAPPLRALAGMAGGGIVLQQQLPTQDPSKAELPFMAAGPGAAAAPQPSPSAPLSFVLPGPLSGTSRSLPVATMSFPWVNPSAGTPAWGSTATMAPTPAWGSTAGAALHLNMHMQVPTVSPAMAMAMTIPSPTPQSDTDLERLAATMSSLRASGWYYEGLSWQESADALQATAPGTFLVRDSSDPRFLFSLSVQTERGPTSIRLHYVCGNFRLDAEPRLAPLMPLFDCVVKLVEYYVELTRNRSQNKLPARDKEQVWVDARGQMYSHILLRSPLYKKQQLPNLQHLARLAINKQVRATGRPAAVAAPHLPLPAPLQTFVREYPYMY